MQADSGIPVVDVSALASSDTVARRRVSKELCDAAETVGFFYVGQHGIAQAQIDELFAISRQFFTAPHEYKQAVAISPHHRGWLDVGATKMYGSDVSDFKESFVWGLDISEDDPDFVAGGRLLAPNQWPEFLPEMRAKLMRYFFGMQECGQQILQALAVGLGIESDYFHSHFDKPVSRGALIYYPPQAADRNGFGSAPHSDYGTLTLLAQDAIGGLQVRAKSGEWVSAAPIPGTFVVNVGDLLARWSNNRLESTPHRVVNTAARARYSIAMFIDPNWDAVIKPAVRAGETPGHAPVRCADYIRERYDEAFAYRKPLEAGGN